jgi:dienelactone hydrolase
MCGPRLAAALGLFGVETRRLAIVVLLGGCTAAHLPAPSPPEAKTWVHTVSAQGGFIEATIEGPVSPAGPKPAVISYLADAREPLLDAGIVVVTYRQHWELLRGLPRPAPPPESANPEPPAPAAPPDDKPRRTYGTWLLASSSPKTVGQAYFQLIDANATGALPQVLDLLAREPEVDMRRIGILGHSTNAFVAMQGVAADRRIGVAALVAGCGDYHRFLHASSLAMKGEPLDLDPAYSRWLRAREAVRHPRRLLHAAVLMVNGRDDQAVPTECATATARVLARAYRRAGIPQRFRFVLVPGGHVISDAARAPVNEWFQRWLLSTPPA